MLDTLPYAVYPKELKAIGDHIRKRRLDLGLFQKELAVAIGVDTCTITNWEKGRTRPELRFIPRIVKFLAYEPPCPEGKRLEQGSFNIAGFEEFVRRNWRGGLG